MGMQGCPGPRGCRGPSRVEFGERDGGVQGWSGASGAEFGESPKVARVPADSVTPGNRFGVPEGYLCPRWWVTRPERWRWLPEIPAGTGRGSGKAKEGERAVYCSVHKHEPLVLFCDTCDTLTCRDCQLNAHKDHQLVLVLLSDWLNFPATLQPPPKEGRSFIRQVTDVQKRVQVDVKMAILQIMKELNKRGKVLVSDAQRVTEGQQEKLERQHWAMTKLQRHQEHILRFTSWALESDNSTALLLSKKLAWRTGDRATVSPSLSLASGTPSQEVSQLGGTQFWGLGGLPGPPQGALTTSLYRRKHLNPPGEEEKFVKKLLIKRAPQPPVFRVFPGTSAEDFSLIVIERGAQPRPPIPLPVKVGEEQQEAAIRDTQDTKPVGLLPEHPGVLGHPGSSLGLGSAPPGAPSGPGVSCCRVCCQAGAVVMCDRCERCYHLDCHLPALQEVPRYAWDPLGSLGSAAPGHLPGLHWFPVPEGRCSVIPVLSPPGDLHSNPDALGIYCPDPWEESRIDLGSVGTSLIAGEL
ncbi:PREDICTED: transcription intermediary factor 1-beta, partial [Pygoscelis adeliae]|uniref:transcription intermediary factor 1-beta n=1 Tax=Pygoscelis adeliae TaxID=9238 RepID=UPI0004F4E915